MKNKNLLRLACCLFAFSFAQLFLTVPSRLFGVGLLCCISIVVATFLGNLLGEMKNEKTK